MRGHSDNSAKASRRRNVRRIRRDRRSGGAVRVRFGHWREHGVIRPSIAGAVALAFDAVLWFMGLLLDDFAFMSAALAVTSVWVVSLLIAVAQWRLVARFGTRFVDDRHGVLVIPDDASPAVRWVLPRSMSVRNQWERRNQDDLVVARYVGRRPDRVRGLYRRTGIFAHWREPFGLWSASCVLPRRDDEIILPKVHESAAGGARLADHRLQGMTQSDNNTGGVRAYAPGDPPKLISWKATAHRGELMTRETSRDVRSSTIVVFDVRSSQPVDGMVSDDWIDVQVEHVMPLLRTSSISRLVVTDGVRFADDADGCARLMASMCTVAPSPSSEGEDFSPERLASNVCDAMVRQSDTVAVRLLTVHPQGALAGALKRMIGDRLLVVDASAAAGADAVTDRLTDVAPDHSRAPLPARADRRNGSSILHARPMPNETVSRLLTAVSLLVFFGLSIISLSSLVAATGYWVWFACVSLGIVAIEANIAARSRIGYVVRVVSTVAAIAVGAGALITVRIHDISRLWWFDRAAFRRLNAEAAAAAANNATGPVAASETTPASLVSGIIERGFDRLNSQLPPITVDQYGDVVLIIAVAVVAIALRLILIVRDTAPAFAVLPISLLASDYALVGRPSDRWQIILIVVMFLVCVWHVHPERTFAPTPTAVTAFVTAVTVAFGSSAVSLAQAVPLSFGDSAGLLSANTINPMIDLRRSLQSGSDSVVLTYRARSRTYLRMATLDEFNGDMWSFDEALSKDANLYGSGIQLGLDSSNMMSDDDRYRNVYDPLSLYMYMEYLGLGENGDGSSSGSNGDGYSSGEGSALYGAEGWMRGWGTDGETSDSSAVSLDSSAYSESVRIGIETLSSRFLPMPGVTSRLEGGVGSDWLTADSTVYSRQTTTSQGMRYAARGIGLSPITSVSQFDGISGINDIYQQMALAAQQVSVDWPERIAARQQLIDDGRAQAYGSWMIMPVNVLVNSGDSGAASDINENGYQVVDNSGSRIGVVDSISGYVSSDDDATRVPLYGLKLDQSFLTQLRVGADEVAGVFYGLDGGMAIALSMVQPEESENVDANGADDSMGNSDYGLAQRSGLDVNYPWFENNLTNLYRELGYRSMMMYYGASNHAEYAQRVADEVDAIDNRARTKYRSLPDDLPENVTKLVAQAKAEGIKTGGVSYEQQVDAMRWLVKYFTDPANGFVYSLNAPDGNGRSNLDVINDFLDSKSGYCAHYASALAVLGRAMGVPTRMVLGYNAGVQKANADGEFEVAAKQLHAWVDAYIDGVGWVPFDVTPATTQNGSASSETTVTPETPGNTTNAQGTTQNQGDAGETTTNGNDESDDQDSQDDESDQQADDSQTTAGASQKDSQQDQTWWSRLHLPRWAVIVIWTTLGVAVLALLAFMPSSIRALRRRRRNRLATESASDRAWLAAWSEIRDTAWDVGIRWKPSDTEHAIALLIAQAMGDGDAERSPSRSQSPEPPQAGASSDVRSIRNLPETERELAMIADRVTAIAFGVSSSGDDRSAHVRVWLDDVLAGLKAVRGRLSLLRRLRIFMLPPSLFSHEKR